MQIVHRRRGMGVVSLVALGCAVVSLAGTRPTSARHGPSGSQRPDGGAHVAAIYDVYGVRFAGYHGFPLSDLVLGADTTQHVDLAFIVWVLKPGAGTIDPSTGKPPLVVFDAGFYRRKFLDQWKPFDFVRPSDAVGKVGVRPEDVTDVIISHIHWDHVDGADLFPRARVWLQRAEYEHYVGANGEPLSRAIDTADAAMLAALRRAGRIRLIDGGAQTVVPGITAYAGGRHTYASQYITVNTSHGIVVLASDNVYMYRNLEKHRPIAETYSRADSSANLEAQERMRHLASDPRFILPGHDPSIFDRFPTPGNGVALIQ